jgi:hypothetical protein
MPIEEELYKVCDLILKDDLMNVLLQLRNDVILLVERTPSCTPSFTNEFTVISGRSAPSFLKRKARPFKRKIERENWSIPLRCAFE